MFEAHCRWYRWDLAYEGEFHESTERVGLAELIDCHFVHSSDAIAVSRGAAVAASLEEAVLDGLEVLDVAKPPGFVRVPDAVEVLAVVEVLGAEVPAIFDDSDGFDKSSSVESPDCAEMQAM